MYAHKGVGLAAQQVGIPLQVTVIDVRGVTDRPSSIEWNGKPGDVNDSMPMVLINPEVTPAGDPAAGPEGCLSFPELYADIARPAVVDVRALDSNAKPIEFRAAACSPRRPARNGSPERHPVH